MHITEIKSPFIVLCLSPHFMFCPFRRIPSANLVHQLCVTIRPLVTPKSRRKPAIKKNSKNYFGYLAEVFYFYHL